jgi:glucokinase
VSHPARSVCSHSKFCSDLPESTRKTQTRVIVGRRHVLRELHAGGPRTPAELASALGRLGPNYSVPIVRERIGELVRLGLVRKGPAPSVGLRVSDDGPKAGRPPDYATLTDIWGLGVGVEIGRSTIRCGITTPSGILVEKTEVKRTARHVEATFAAAAGAVDRLVGALTSPQRDLLRGVVVAVPAPIDRHDRLASPDILKGADAQPLDEAFGERLAAAAGLPVEVLNDANVRAIGEGRFGLARASHSAFVVKVSGGIGGALLRRGRVLEGFRGLAGELGHIGVPLDAIQQPERATKLGYLLVDAECSCGDSGGQHLEAYASTDAIARRVSDARGEAVTFDEIVAQRRTHADAKAAVADAGRLLGVALANVAMLCDPATIVVTGRFAACGEEAIKPVEAVLGQLRPRRLPPAVVVDGPRPDAGDETTFQWVGVVGAGRRAIEHNTSAEDPPLPMVSENEPELTGLGGEDMT